MECPFKDSSLPEEVRENLLDFAVGHAVEVPGDVDAFGLKHFVEALAYRQSKKAEEDESRTALIDESGADLPSQPASRRNGILFTVEKDGSKSLESRAQMTPSRKLKAQLHLKKVFPFKYLDDSLLVKVLERMIRVSVRAGDVIVRQGDSVFNFFIIESGIFEELVVSGGASISLYKYDSWGCFQLASLISPTVAQSNFVARTDGVLWAISCIDFRSVASSHDEEEFTAKSTCLQQLPYIADLPSSDKNKLVDGVDFLSFKKGEFIIKGTADSNGLYRVVSGKVTLRWKRNGSPDPKSETPEQMETITVGPGETFGDLTMFCHRLSGTRAVAEQPCEVLRLSASAFERLLGPFNKYFVAGTWKQEMVKMRCGHWEWLPLHGELTGLVAEYKLVKPADFLKFGWDYYRSKALGRKQPAPRFTDQEQAGVEGVESQNTNCLQLVPTRTLSSFQTAQFLQLLEAKQQPSVQELETIPEPKELPSLPKRPPFPNNTIQHHVKLLVNPPVQFAGHEWGDCVPEVMHSSHNSKFSVGSLTYTILDDTPTENQWKKLRRVLKSVPIFKAMGDGSIDDIIRSMRLVSVSPGHYIMKTQMRGSHFYIIEEGS